MMLSSPKLIIVSECRNWYHRVRSLVLYNYTIFEATAGAVSVVKGPLLMTQERSSDSSYSTEGAAEICTLLVDFQLALLMNAVINHGN